MIGIQNLTKFYKNKKEPAVDNVSFSIGKGEIVGLLGPNGAGKTTIMKMISCYMNPTGGEISVNGINTVDDPVAVKELIGYLPEHVPQYEGMTVYEYLKFTAEIRGIRKEEIHKAIKRMAKITSLESVITRNISELSNGYRKRVGLASVMIHDPKILILDEPTAGLDPNQIITFRKILRRLSTEKTIILSTHVLSEIEATCERVIIIQDGTIVANDTLQDLLNTYSHEKTMIFTIEAKETVVDVENEVNTVEGAWKIEFERKDAKNEFRFKGFISQDSDFENNLKKRLDQKGWKLVHAEKNSVDLEEIFLKLTSEEEKSVK